MVLGVARYGLESLMDNLAGIFLFVTTSVQLIIHIRFVDLLNVRLSMVCYAALPEL